MRRIAFGVLVLGMIAVAFLALMRTVEADQPPRGDTDVLRQVQRDLKAVKAELGEWVEKHKALRAEFDKLKTAFRRHSHPVKFWDPEKKRAAAWTEPGSFFIAYPKVGAGDKDEDAAKAGGTWGTP